MTVVPNSIKLLKRQSSKKLSTNLPHLSFNETSNNDQSDADESLNTEAKK
jgi:hypothetical protein